MTVHVGTRTVVEFDRETGKIRVYDLNTGELLYELKVKPCRQP